MSSMFGNKSKKPSKYTRRYLSLGIPTNIVTGPLGFGAELDIDPKGERNQFPSRFRPNPTTTLDEKRPRAPRIVFNDTKVKTPTPGVAVDDTENGKNPASDRSDICDHTRSSCGHLRLSPLGEDIGDTGEEEGEPGVMSMGTHYVVHFPSTFLNFGESIGEHSTRGCQRSH